MTRLLLARKTMLLCTVVLWSLWSGGLAYGQHVVTGTVTDDTGAVVPGVNVLIKNTSTGTSTDADGKYSLEVPGPDAVVVFSFIGYQPQEARVGERAVLDVALVSDIQALDEVVVVAYGEQKRESMVGSITTVNPSDMKVPSSNMTTAIAGRIAGVISYQRSGEPGADNAQFFIRGITSFGSGKVDPLILIDGMESSATDLARLQPDDIKGFSILKDATASALFGARGANGVVLVTTKSGMEGQTRFSVRMENSVSSNTQNFQLADNITYMQLANEAVLTRNPLGVLPYSQTKIDHTKAGDDPLLYPNNNWIDQLVKDYTVNQRFNFNVRGGGKRARFYLAGTYNHDNGVLKVAELNNFNSNISLNSYSIRSNVDMNLTPTTTAIVRTYGQFDDYKGPVGGGSVIFGTALWSNPVMFPSVYPGSFLPYVKHPLFGNAAIDEDTYYLNPFARSVSGYQDWNQSTLIAQLELKQDLEKITPGLSANLMAYTRRYSYFDVTRQYSPFYYQAYNIEGSISLTLLNEESGTEYLDYNEGAKTINTTTYAQASVNYNHTFSDKHDVSGMLITILQNYLTANAGDLQSSLPSRNQGLSGRFTYGYDSRYMAEFNFGYNGSERFHKSHRFGFFPSAGLAWNMSNEAFFEPAKKVVTQFKLRGTYGLVGNDQIGDRSDRFFYLSNVNINDSNKGATFGTNYSYSRPGVTVTRYENNEISWEKAYKGNIGFEMGLWNQVKIIADFFQEHRTNILMSRAYIPTTMGLSASVRANVGEAKSHGMDMSVEYNRAFGRDTWLQARGNFTYAASEYVKVEEPSYPAGEKYRSVIGKSIKQQYGLIAERLFVDDEEVANSPFQNYGEYRGGDLKYRDVNGDGQITDADRVPLGYPTVPEIIYGFGFSIGHKNFDFSTFFQGSARSSIFINATNISPFILRNYEEKISTSTLPGYIQNGLLEVVADSHWSEENRDLYAFWPRLSDDYVNNNTQTSSWWLRNGAFLRLKTVELGYTFPGSMLDRLKITSSRLYVNASNLFVISGFDLWDPEMGGDGLGYPVQRVFNIGIMVDF